MKAGVIRRTRLTEDWKKIIVQPVYDLAAGSGIGDHL